MRPPAADAAGAGARLSRPNAASPPPPPPLPPAAASPSDVVRQAYGAYGAWLAGGATDAAFGPLAACFAEDIVWQSNVNGGFRGQGTADLKRYFTWLAQANQARGFDIQQMIESGREVVVVVEHSGTGTVTGKQYSGTMVQLLAVDTAGRIASSKEFVGPAAVEALAGVPFPPPAA
ncbi:hypothetical protein HXX76_009662 [Chlamydomonas incerta]|uniref:SnoaL-like domain-containing protein n=1 Tax=Chlamydomonas incerta TaxID=51695 RepID=A0A835STE0_CHLIN|nr:hypothetical protein HXX76_009662 [Chlamydomonas incerta]|eukprot:KAG2431132.1 hypothetical protein HXX76_009662 [Chlamydomonas incerta]